MRPALLILALTAGLANAAEPASVLRYMPKEADVAVVVDNPRLLANAIGNFEPLRQLLTFEAVKEQFDSTNTKRFRQLIAYYEKALGKSWPELLDSLAGGGAAFGVRFGEDAPALLVMKSTDEALLQRAVTLLIDVAKQENERLETPLELKSAEYRGFTGYQLGKDAYMAATGPVLFFSNKSEAIKLGIDLYVNGAHESFAATEHPAAARALLPPNPAAWIVGNTKRLHEMSEAQQAYQYPKGDIGQLILFQGITDVLGKSPFVAAGIYPSPDGGRTVVRFPAGRDATPDGLALHFPTGDQPSTLPLLEPKNVLLSYSFYMDQGKLWAKREKLLTEPTRKAIEAGEKQIGPFLGGRRLGDFITGLGTHHRLVVAHQANPGYKRKPDQLQPAFAFVSDTRGSAYSDAMNAVLRTVALGVGAQFKLKYKEEMIGDVKLVTYRFPEDAELPQDVGNARFSFSPCFAKVRDSFMMSSTVELGRELVGVLQQPAKSAASVKTSQVRVYAEGGAALLKAFEDQLLTQTVLDRAVPVAEAKREAEKLIAWVRALGRLDITVNYGAKDMEIEFNLANRGR